MLFLHYPRCTTCQRAKKWLDEQGVAYEARDIVQNRPTCAELKEWQERSGLEPKRFFNTSGIQYRALNLKDKLPYLSQEQMFELLGSDGKLVKRPLLVTDDKVLVGFKPEQWAAALRG
ncbi:MAG: arsenate reductase family protein [Succinivibrio sp.]|nr:arsenate reductase family protein [Succinivibrio sp.]